MKKIILLIPLAALTSSVVVAQPTIHSNDMPLAGDYYYKTLQAPAGTYSPGSAGANQTWDFSQMPSAATYEMHNHISSCSGSAICNDFPNANYYSNLVDTTTPAQYSIYEVTDDSFNVIGTINSNGSFHADDPETEYKFPMTYNQEYNDHFSFISGNSGQHGYNVNKVDGYGTIKTPVGTYTNVLRYKTTKYDTGYSGSVTNTVVIVSYAWIKAGIGLVAAFQTAENFIIFSYNEQADVPSGISQYNALNDHINIYPNPARTDHINIVCNELVARNIVLTDITGKTLFKEDVAKGGINNTYQIPLSGIASGIYLIHLDTDKGKAVRKISVMK